MTGTPARRRILIVCLGNYCRSPYAALLLARHGGDYLDVRSAGLVDKWVGGTAHPDMITAASERGYDLTRHRPAKINQAAVNSTDLILAMDRAVLARLVQLVGPEDADKLKLYLDDQDVPDPMGRPLEEFRACARLIEDGIHRYLR